MKFSNLALNFVMIIIALTLSSCAKLQHADLPASKSVESFQFIGAETTIQQLITKLGEPDRDIGSGIYVFVYDLSDGTEIQIGSADGSHILYAKHGADILFKKR